MKRALKIVIVSGDADMIPAINESIKMKWSTEINSKLHEAIKNYNAPHFVRFTHVVGNQDFV